MLRYLPLLLFFLEGIPLFVQPALRSPQEFFSEPFTPLLFFKGSKRQSRPPFQTRPSEEFLPPELISGSRLSPILDVFRERDVPFSPCPTVERTLFPPFKSTMFVPLPLWSTLRRNLSPPLSLAFYTQMIPYRLPNCVLPRPLRYLEGQELIPSRTLSLPFKPDLPPTLSRSPYSPFAPWPF